MESVDDKTRSAHPQQPEPENNFPTQQQKKIIWRAVTGLGIAIIGVLAAALIWVISNILSFLQPVLIPLAIAGVIAYLLDPIVAWLQKKGLSRLKSVLAVFSLFLLLLAILVPIVLVPITKQINDTEQREAIEHKIRLTLEGLSESSWIKPSVDWALAEHQDPAHTHTAPATNLEPKASTSFSKSNLAHTLRQHTGKILNTIAQLITSSTSSIMSVLGLFIGLAMVPIYLYYFLKESAAIKKNWHSYVPLRASHFKTEVVETLREINGYLISFFRGQVLVSMIDGVLVGIALTIFQLPYGVLIGVLLAFLGVIPFIGNMICLIPACLIAYVHFSNDTVHTHQWLLGTNPWAYVGAVAAIFIIVQQINSIITAPKIVGESVGLHPMTVIFSMLFWSLILGGFLGALLAVPMTAAVKVLFRRYIWQSKINVTPP